MKFRSKRSVAVVALIVVLCIFYFASWFLGGGEKRNTTTTSNNGGGGGLGEERKDNEFESFTTVGVKVVEEVTKEKENGPPKDDINPKRPTATTTTTTTTTRSRYEDERTTDSYCIWAPNQQWDCKNVLKQRLKKKKDGIIPRRWLFLGDSTISQLWRTSSLSRILVDFGLSQIEEDCSRRYKCHSKSLQQCSLNEQFELSLPVSGKWESPLPGQEGPVIKTNGNNKNNNDHHCFGCKNCISNLVACSTIDETRHCRKNAKQLSYGGYIAMPYSRDVLLQTPQYRTTQENILLRYIGPQWNTMDLLEDFDGKPICVVRTGFHDVAIVGITTKQYVTNVIWYLQLLQNHICSHIVWLQNTAPLLHETTNEEERPPPKFPQTVERIREYDLAVYEALQQQQQQQQQSNNSKSDGGGGSLQDMVTTMDVFEASKTWSHDDNIHLSSDWNRALGMFFVKLSTRK